MRVVVEYRDGHYSLRAFAPDYTVEAYRPPTQWDTEAVEVPDAIVAAYASLSAQMGVMQFALRQIDDAHARALLARMKVAKAE